MTTRLTLALTSLIAVTALTACSGHAVKVPKLEDAKFWQRASTSSAIYMRGPKAQQMLHQDIANCVTEIRELRNLGEIRRAIPSNYNSGNDSQQILDHYDSPARNGYLYAEHADYHDFETCMNVKGWERVEYLPADDADAARQKYLDRVKSRNQRTKIGRENVTTIHQPAPSTDDYDNLNE